MTPEEAHERSLKLLKLMLPNSTEFQRLAISELMRQTDMSKGMPTPGSPEERALMEIGGLALEALGLAKSEEAPPQ